MHTVTTLGHNPFAKLDNLVRSSLVNFEAVLKGFVFPVPYNEDVISQPVGACIDGSAKQNCFPYSLTMSLIGINHLKSCFEVMVPV